VKVSNNKRSKKRVTMSDIAREAGCSQATVSIVLGYNDSVQISGALRTKVFRVAKEMGYQIVPKRTAEITPVFTRVAFVIDSLTTSPEAIVAIEGVRQALSSTNALLVITETGNDPTLEPFALQTMIDDGADVIIYACIFTRMVALPPVLQKTKVPVVLLNCYTDEWRHPSVQPSEIAGGTRATGVLLEAGHIRIGTITGEDFMEATQDRLTGYRRAIASADIAFDHKLVVKGDWSVSAGFEGTRKLMSLESPPTAIFCQNDRMAVGCYEYLKEHGYVIPRDVSVVGYDDEEISRHLSPPLTTLVLPHRAMGRWAIEQILLAHPHDGKPIKLECLLIERASVATVKPDHN